MLLYFPLFPQWNKRIALALVSAGDCPLLPRTLNTVHAWLVWESYAEDRGVMNEDTCMTSEKTKLRTF